MAEPYNAYDYMLEDTKRIEEKAGRFHKGDETVEISCIVPDCDETRRIATANLDQITEPILCEGHAAMKNIEGSASKTWLTEDLIIRSHPHLNIIKGSLIYDIDRRKQTVKITCSEEDCDETIIIQTQSLHATAGLCEWHLLEHRRKKNRDYVARWRERQGRKR